MIERRLLADLTCSFKQYQGRLVKSWLDCLVTPRFQIRRHQEPASAILNRQTTSLPKVCHAHQFRRFPAHLQAWTSPDALHQQAGRLEGFLKLPRCVLAFLRLLTACLSGLMTSLLCVSDSWCGYQSFATNAPRKLSWCHTAERAMWTGFIVITSPSCDDGTGVFECQEPVVV